MRIIILLLALSIPFLSFIIYINADYEIRNKKKRKKCFKNFQEMYPLSSLCPGKENSPLCSYCPHYMDNHRYKIDKLPKAELDINGFQNKDWENK